MIPNTILGVVNYDISVSFRSISLFREVQNAKKSWDVAIQKRLKNTGIGGSQRAQNNNFVHLVIILLLRGLLVYI